MSFLRNSAKAGVALAAAALAIGAAAPAYAADPTIDGDGVVTIGDAYWEFDEYGVQYGWDVADTYGPNGYIYYPGYVYGGNAYPYCGDDGPQSGSTVTVEPNGDLTIVCPAGEWGTSGLIAQWTFRVYAESSTGYLVRQFLTVTNPTADPVDLAEASPHTLYYFDGYTGQQGTLGFTTSLASDTVQANDTWYVSVNATGASVAETNAWALTGSAPASGIVANSSSPSVTYGPADNLYAPGETKYFVAFTNMVIPATQDVAGAEAAYFASLALTADFASFSGRLVEGLPAGITVVGWGATPAAEAALADTGSDTQATIVLVGSTAGILALAGGLLISSSRRRSARS